MSARPETIREVSQWVEKAEHDLINARHSLRLKSRCPFDTVCFHAQQCAEKYLKALLVYESIKFPKNHDLRIMIQLLPVWDQLAGGSQRRPWPWLLRSGRL